MRDWFENFLVSYSIIVIPKVNLDYHTRLYYFDPADLCLQSSFREDADKSVLPVHV